ncbi:MAG: hypothetical protein E7487_06970 [Ruminococcaceae bacterium]|nr:hypothetical protein [Oscillospiraceae bacterium]
MNADITYQFRDFFRYLESDPELTTFLAIYIVILLAILAVGVLVGAATYVMTAIAVMKMAKKRGISKAWLAWIPVANTYVFGKISETPDKKRKTAVILLILHIAYSMMAGIYAGMVSVTVGMIAQLEYGSIEEAGVIIVFVMMMLSFVVFLASAVAYMVIYYMAFYRICKLFGGSQHMTYFLLGLIPVVLGIGIALPIALLVLAAKEPDDSNMFPKPPIPRWGQPDSAQPPQNHIL